MGRTAPSPPASSNAMSSLTADDVLPFDQDTELEEAYGLSPDWRSKRGLLKFS